MKSDRRVVIIILDSVGIGALPDAAKYGDELSDTLGNIAKESKILYLPNMVELGLGNIKPINKVKAAAKPSGSFGKMAESSAGKDTISGHWEIVGLINEKPFPLYPNGFPPEVVEPLKEAIGTDILGNIPASGTEIIARLGAEHLKTAFPIVYTSADSVFQIAAHEEVIPLKRLYEMCEIARGILTGKHSVGRVIARPFVGEPGNFVRTYNRKDYSIKPPEPTLLDRFISSGRKVLSIGKIDDIFAHQGISESIHTDGNTDGIQKTIKAIGGKSAFSLIFTNLIDFDMKYGHRNNIEGYAAALNEFDDALPRIIENLQENDMLIITADHGCDPTTPGTDHTREYVPLLVYGKKLKSGVNLGTRASFSDVAQTVAEYFQFEKMKNGDSFLKAIL